MIARTPPPLEPGETLVRTYSADAGRVSAAARRVQARATALLAVGVAVFAGAFAVAFVIPPLGGGMVLAGFGLLVVSRVALGGSVGLDPKRLPDIVYLTDRRVIVDQGRAWTSVVATPLAAIRDVVLWNSPTMKTAGLTWAYLMPLGAQRVEVRSMGELTTAPGVVEIQNLATPDAQDLRARALGRASSFAVTAGPGPLP